MKRDKDLIVRILRAIEASDGSWQASDLEKFEDLGYSNAILKLHCELLHEAQFVRGLDLIPMLSEGLQVRWTPPIRLTWQGYEFLDRVVAPGTSMDATSFTTAAEPERVLWEGQPDWGHYLGAALIGLLFLLVGVGLFVWIWIPIDRSTRQFTLTTRRVKTTVGLFSRKTNEVSLADIRLINLNKGFFERLFGLGSIEIGSAGTGQVEVTFLGIKGSQKVKDLIDRHRDLSQGGANL